jgi:hypothetical protein
MLKSPLCMCPSTDAAVRRRIAALFRRPSEPAERGEHLGKEL